MVSPSANGYSLVSTTEVPINGHYSGGSPRSLSSRSSSTSWSSSHDHRPACGCCSPHPKGVRSALLVALLLLLALLPLWHLLGRPSVTFPSPSPLSSLRFGPLNLSSYASPHAVDSSRAVQLPRAEQLRYDQEVLRGSGLRLSVVFFTLVSERYEWRPLLQVMVREMIEWGLAYSASLNFVISTESGADAPTSQSTQQLLYDCEDLILQLLAEAQPPLAPEQLAAVTVLTSLGNAFEYPGLARVWTLARQSPDPSVHQHIVLYYHSKGMFNKDDTGQPFHARSKKNWMLSQMLVRPWRSHLQRFADDQRMRKLGHSVSREGFLWMNFMYMRADYVRLLVRPQRMQNRFWHEWWASMLEPARSPNCSRPCRWNDVPQDASLDSLEGQLFPCSGADTPDPGNMGLWCWAGPGHSWPVAAGDQAWSGKIVLAEDWHVLQMHGNASLETAPPRIGR